jgi:hypothetical protein
MASTFRANTRRRFFVPAFRQAVQVEKDGADFLQLHIDLADIFEGLGEAAQQGVVVHGETPHFLPMGVQSCLVPMGQSKGCAQQGSDQQRLQHLLFDKNVTRHGDPSADQKRHADNHEYQQHDGR